MIAHILVGVDGSPASRHAARVALSMAEQLKAKATLVFVLETPPVIPIGPLSGYVTTAPPRTDRDAARAAEELDTIGREHPAVACDKRVEIGGSAADVLCALASALSVDLLAVGARGLGFGTRWLLGSVSDRVVHHAPCPTLVVRERQHAPGPGPA